MKKQNICELNDIFSLNIISADLDYFPKHWHKRAQIVYVVDGSCKINVNDSIVELPPDNIYMLNPFEVHDLTTSSNFCSLELDIDFSFLQGADQTSFYVNSTVMPTELFNEIKLCLTELVRSTSISKNKEQLYYSIAHKLYFEISNNFSKARPQISQDKSLKNQTLIQVLKYLAENYTKPLLLTDVANKFFITSQYLSKLFTQNLSTSYKKYLDEIRFNHAYKQLIQTDKSIEEIAFESGFANPRSFTTLFRKKYGVLPSKYRSEYNKNSQKTKKFNQEERHLFIKIAQRLENLTSKPVQSYDIEQLNIGEVNFLQEEKKLRHTCLKFISVIKARDLLLKNVQDLLKKTQKEIGFDYIKFHGLLDDSMMVYNELESGEIRLNFLYIDLAIDFILSIGLRPFVEFSYMPSLLAKNPNATIYNSPSIVSEPKDIKKWDYLITNLMNHWKQRYGLSEIKKWFFVVWNLPDMVNNTFYSGTDESFYRLFKHTYNCVKAIDPDLKFGSPSNMDRTFLKDYGWFDKFIEFSKSNKCLPDFITFHFYPVITSSLAGNVQIKKQLALDTNPDLLKHNIEAIRKKVTKLGINSKIYMTEWNSTVSNFDLINDTVFKASYIVKNICENYDELESFCYWSLSDFMEEVAMDSDPFHGGLGMVTTNGIEKPHYYAYCLISKLCDSLIKKGDGYFITKNDNQITIMLYNYRHYSEMYASGEKFDLTYYNRYRPFTNVASKKFTMQLTNLPNEKITQTSFFINRSHGSAFDTWLKIGGVPLNEEETSLLRKLSAPRIRKKQLTITDNNLFLEAHLEPFEVQLITLQFNK